MVTRRDAGAVPLLACLIFAEVRAREDLQVKCRASGLEQKGILPRSDRPKEEGGENSR